MDIKVDFARADDLDAMADLLVELFTLESDFVPARAKQLAGLRLILEQPACGQLFVVRADDAVVGMANALFTVSTAEGKRVVLLEDVIIAARFRGHGLGRRLIEHIVAWAATNGLPRITLLADRDNAPALAFYARLGFALSAMHVLRTDVPTAP